VVGSESLFLTVLSYRVRNRAGVFLMRLSVCCGVCELEREKLSYRAVGTVGNLWVYNGDVSGSNLDRLPFVLQTFPGGKAAGA
jgi:hypothetical protein